MLRFLYVCLLRLHPRRFRQRFAEEMLCIFDEAGYRRALFADGIVSLCRQWILRSESPATSSSATRAYDSVPMFYSVGNDTPRPGALLNGAILSLAVFMSVCLVLRYSGTHRSLSSLLVGSHNHSFSHLLEARSLNAAPAELTTKVNVNPEPEDLDREFALKYFRMMLVLGALDADRDLVISAAEIANAPAALAKLDTNHDGKLSPEECGQGPFPAGLSPSDLKRARLGFMRLNPILAALDTDHDGEISASEIKNSWASLKSLDTNRDGKLTTSEVLPDPVASLVGQFMLALDQDGDGQISRSERSGALGLRLHSLLDAADRNNDGVVTGEELANEIRRRADLNGDGVVTRRELRNALQSGALFAATPVEWKGAIPTTR
jgi:Ca2+-binding EF-hand superfamily protein